MLIKLIIELAIGGFCGYVANRIMNGQPKGMLWNVVIGIVGGIVGGFLGNLIGIGGGWLTGILLSIGGSCLIIWLFKKFAK